MAVHDHPHRRGGFHLPTRRRTTAATAPSGSAATDTATAATATAASAYVLASLRIAIGFIFLWAFLDKTFGLGYATASDSAWINGGSPTEGFLGSINVGPMESVFNAWAGDAWADWLFMLGLLGIGLAAVSGIGLRIAALSGTVMMALMWVAEWPPAKHLSDGSLSMSTNPLIDYHLIYAAVLIALAVLSAGETWGLGRIWARVPIVRRNAWLR